MTEAHNFIWHSSPSDDLIVEAAHSETSTYLVRTIKKTHGYCQCGGEWKSVWWSSGLLGADGSEGRARSRYQCENCETITWMFANYPREEVISEKLR